MPASAELPRKLGLVDATSIVAGTMIGSGIFLVPSTIAQNVGSADAILVMWVLAGIFSMLGALAYAELGAMMPATGGQYVYLREAWGPLWGFLCGWTFFFAARSGGTAAVAAGFSIYFAQFVPMPVWGTRLVAAGLIVVLTAINYRGVRLGATVQNIFTVMKLVGLAVIIGSAFLSSAPAAIQPAARAVTAAQWGAGLTACVWACNGWYALSLVAGEVRDPERNLPRAIAIGTGLALTLYVLANLAYFRILTVGEIAGSGRVAETMANRTMGSIGASFVAITILCSTFGTTNGNVLTAARLYFAQARDGLFFAPFGRVHPQFETPHISLVGQGMWAALLALSGTYVQLISFAAIAFWVFYGMTVAGLIRLRFSQPDAPRPYRLTGYPWTAAAFVLVAIGVVAFGLIGSPGTTLAGFAVIAAGVPVYYLRRRYRTSTD